jgi:hypothetical protein
MNIFSDEYTKESVYPAIFLNPVGKFSEKVYIKVGFNTKTAP